MADLTAGDMVGMLRKHYLPENRAAGGIFAVEIGSPAGNRRADAIWAPLTIAGGSGLVGHEIKVSRADLIAELEDPTKSEEWGQYCTQWWLVLSDPAMADGLVIPEAWGIMAPPAGRRTRSMTVVRQAPKRRAPDAWQAWRRLAAWSFYGQRDANERLRTDLRAAKNRNERLQQLLNDRSLAASTAKHPHAERVANVLRLFDGHTNRWSGDLPFLWPDVVSDEQIAEALVDLAYTRSLARNTLRDLENLIGDVSRAAQPLGIVKKQLKAIKDRTGVEA